MNNTLLNKWLFLEKIADSLAGDLHKEKEYRIDLKKLPKECDGIKPIIIKQGVLREIKENGKVAGYCRIRSMHEPGKAIKYSLGVKNFNKNEESESEISKETFDMWYPGNLDKPQEKKRYKLSNGWTIDKKNDGGIVAEYEYKNKNEIPDVPKHWEK